MRFFSQAQYGLFYWAFRPKDWGVWTWAWLVNFYRDNCHESSSVGEYRKPVKYPLEDIRDISQSGAVELIPEVSEEEHRRGSDAAGQDVDNDEKCEARGRIVEEETEGIWERDPENTKEDYDESEGSPAVMEEERLLVIKGKYESVHDEGWAQIQQHIPGQVRQPEHTWRSNKD